MTWHGTHAGYAQHYRDGTAVCRPCREAKNAYNRAWRAENRSPRSPLDPVKCGTVNQARNHYRRGEKPCEDCRQAQNRHRADTRSSRAKPDAKRGRPKGSLDKTKRRKRSCAHDLDSAPPHE